MSYRDARRTTPAGNGWACRQAAARVDDARRDLRIAIGLIAGRPIPAEVAAGLKAQAGALERLTDNLRRLAAALEADPGDSLEGADELVARAEAIALGHRHHLETRLPYPDD